MMQTGGSFFFSSPRKWLHLLESYGIDLLAPKLVIISLILLPPFRFLLFHDTVSPLPSSFPSFFPPQSFFSFALIEFLLDVIFFSATSVKMYIRFQVF